MRWHPARGLLAVWHGEASTSATCARAAAHLTRRAPHTPISLTRPITTRCDLQSPRTHELCDEPPLAEHYLARRGAQTVLPLSLERLSLYHPIALSSASHLSLTSGAPAPPMVAHKHLKGARRHPLTSAHARRASSDRGLLKGAPHELPAAPPLVPSTHVHAAQNALVRAPLSGASPHGACA